jgi:hypothetical protein
MKLLLLLAFILPLLVPNGFMAQRNAETQQFEITLCPSAFSKVAINALSGAATELQSHHAHHFHTSHLDEADKKPTGVDHSSHGEGGSSEPCPLAGPGAIVVEIADVIEFTANPISIFYAEQPLAARAKALLPPPVRGPPTLT